MVLLAGAVGCGREGRDSVVSYTVPKEPDSALDEGNAAPPPIEPGAALPDGHPPIGGASDPESLLPAGHPPLDGSVTAAPALPVQPIAPGEESMQWVLPDGWTASPNAGSMRFATVRSGEGDGQIEVAISRLLGGGGGLVANVNLWRQQVGLTPLPAEEIPALVEPIVTSSGDRGGLFDVTGVPAEGNTTSVPRILVGVFPTQTHTWFVKTTGDEATLSGHRPDFVDFCTSVSFTTSGAGAPPTSRPAVVTNPPAAAPPGAGAPDGMAWGALPSGWTVDASPKTMSVASITIARDDQQGSFTITPLGGVQDLLGNVNRWRGQVGVSAAPDASAMDAVPITVSGTPGHLVEIIGPDRGILGAIVKRGPTTWFYKLSGPAPLVQSQRAAFETFLSTVRHDG